VLSADSTQTRSWRTRSPRSRTWSSRHPTSVTRSSGRQFKEEIEALTENLTVYVSSNDRALLMSRVLNRDRRLGESTVDPANPDQSEEASEALELVDAVGPRVTLVDVTAVNRTRNFHNFSLESPEFFDDLYLRLTSTQTPRTRLQYRVRTSGGSEYWVLTRGR
jgi:hypothetical protein